MFLSLSAFPAWDLAPNKPIAMVGLVFQALGRAETFCSILGIANQEGGNVMDELLCSHLCQVQTQEPLKISG